MLYAYPTDREFRPSPEIWAIVEGRPLFMMNVVDQAQLPGTERETRYWVWSEELHSPRFGPRPDRMYLRVPSIGGETGFVYAVDHRTDLGCTERAHCELGTRCEVGSSFACVEGCGSGGFDRGCPEGEVCSNGRCVEADCSGHADCELGQACQRSICVDAPCESDMPCQAFGLRVCDEQAGHCLECFEPGDCPFPESATCVANRCGIACTEDAFAPNQSRDTAKVLELDSPFSAPELTLCGLYAEDWFRFTLDEASPLRITTTFDEGEGDIDIRLYREGETLPLAAAETDRAPERIILPSVPAGSYELWIYFWPRPGDAIPPSRAMQSYGLAISTASLECEHHRDCAADRVCVDYLCLPTSCEHDLDCVGYAMPCDESAGYCAECGEDSDCGHLEACVANRREPTCDDDLHEDNDTRETAAALPDGRHELILCKARGESEEDWYRFDLQAGELLALNLLHLGGVETYAGPTQFAPVEVYRQNGELLPIAGDGVMPISWRAESAETFYARVAARAAGGAMDGGPLGGPLAYALVVGREPECVPTDYHGASDTCESTEICSDFVCAAGCRSSQDCPAGDLCIMGTCNTPQCSSQADCQPEASCAWRFCVPAQACDEDFDCTWAQRSDTTNARYCDQEAGRCVECMTHECGTPLSCVEHACVFLCEDDPHEPNDSLETATPLGFGTHVDLRLCDAPADASDPRDRKDDWYEVMVSAGEGLVVRVEWPPGQYRFDLEIHDAAGLLVGDSAYYDQTVLEVRARSAETQPLYVRVKRSEAWSTTPYTLTLKTLECEVHSECGLGQACMDYACVDTSCAADSECSAWSPYFLCDEAAGICRECLVDSDCIADYYVCPAGHCVLDCVPDRFEQPDMAAPAPIELPFAAEDLTLCGMFDQDFFAFALAANRTYAMRATPSTHGADAILLTLHRLDPAGPIGLIPVKNSAANGASQVLTFTTGPSATPYVLEVRWMVNDGSLTYDLAID